MCSLLNRKVIYFFAAIVIFFVAMAAFIVFDYQRFLKTPAVTVGSNLVFNVKSGDNIGRLIKKFPSHRIEIAAKSPLKKYLGRYYFRYFAKESQLAGQLKVGEYQLNVGMTPPEILGLLVSGKTIVHKVRFLEGWSFKQIRATLEKADHVEQTLEYVPDKDIIEQIDPGNATFYEGQFFPDTYQFSNYVKDLDILKQAHHLMQKNLEKAWQARDKSIQLKSPYELLILASLIEKETSLDSERKQISGVFHRRLAKGMRLQTDPTVIYGMGDKYKGTIYKSDLKRDTPYNTYTRQGFPPTPIASPGMASLMAAGQPDKGKSLYFVANGTGGHTFSDTYKEHLKAVKVYREQKKQQTQQAQQQDEQKSPQQDQQKNQ